MSLTILSQKRKDRKIGINEALAP